MSCSNHTWSRLPPYSCLDCKMLPHEYSREQQERMLHALDSIDATMKALLGAMTEAVEEDEEQPQRTLDGEVQGAGRDQTRPL